MTAPIEEFMPYGMTFKPSDGSSYVNNPASSSSHISSHGLALPSAPVTVSASWTGAEECGVYLSRNRVLSHIGTIPAKSGGGSVLPSLFSSEASRATTSTSTVAQPGTEKEAQPAPSPSYPPQPSAPGGGLGDHTNRESRRLISESGCAQSCLERHDSAGDGRIPGRNVRQGASFFHSGGHVHRHGEQHRAIYCDTQNCSWDKQRGNCWRCSAVFSEDVSGRSRNGRGSIHHAVGYSEHKRRGHDALRRADRHRALVAKAVAA